MIAYDSTTWMCHRLNDLTFRRHFYYFFLLPIMNKLSFNHFSFLVFAYHLVKLFCLVQMVLSSTWTLKVLNSKMCISHLELFPKPDCQVSLLPCRPLLHSPGDARWDSQCVQLQRVSPPHSYLFTPRLPIAGNRTTVYPSSCSIQNYRHPCSLINSIYSTLITEYF